MNQPPLRILHLLDTDNFAGTERYVLQQILGLRAAGAEPILACLNAGLLHKAATAEDLETWPVWNGTGARSTFRGYRRIKARLRLQPVDLFQAHNGRTTLMAAALSATTGIAAIGTQHFLKPRFASYRGLKHWIASAAHRWVNDHLAHVICVSDAARDSMIRREAISPSKLSTIHTGIDPINPPSPGRIADLRRSMHVGTEDLLITCVARLEAEKSIADLIAAMPLIVSRRPHARLVIVGNGSLRTPLQSQIEAMNLTGRVSLVGHRRDAVDFIAACDVFVLPSTAETFGIVLLEAMSLAKPVIACRTGGPTEIILDHESGLLVPPSDPLNLAAAIVRLLDDDALRQRLSLSGLERFRLHFTTRRMIDDVLQVYHAVIAQRTARTASGLGAAVSPQPTP
jgi:glycosyltransferase involved in cell wall biosynthesis